MVQRVLLATSQAAIDPAGRLRAGPRKSGGFARDRRPRPRGATRLHRRLRRQPADNSPRSPSERRGADGTFLGLINSRARGGERNVRRHQHGARAVSSSVARALLAAVAGIGALTVVAAVATGEA